MGRSLKHFFALVLLLAALPASAAQISVPSSVGPGFLLQSLSTGVYATVKLIAGTNVTISTTTSAITINSSGSGSGFSTTSADYWATVRNFFSTTSADYWKTQNNFFSTTSASFFSSAGLAFSTTSADYYRSTKWETNYPFPLSATSSLLTFTGGFISSGSTTINHFDALAGTTTNATSSNQYISVGINVAGSSTFNGNATTTGTFFAGNASSTKLFGANLSTCSGSNFLQWSGGLFACGTPSAGSTFSYPFPNSATSSPLMLLASTTIGAGGLTTGLTVSGGATTTGIAYFGSNVGIGTTTPYGLLGLGAPGGSAPLFVIGSSTEVMSVYSANHAQLSLGSTTPWAQFSINPTNLNLAAPSFAIGSTTGTQFVVLNNGNTGVATATPGSLFAVGGALNLTAATSTFLGTGGINLTSGCFAINTVCISGGTDIQFSTTSANYWATLGLAFSTTSANFWGTTGSGFSTTSATFFSSLGLAFSTSSENGYVVTKWFNNYPFTNITFGSGILAAGTSTVLFPAQLAAGSSTVGTITATSSVTNKSVTSALVLNASNGLEGAYGGASACASNNFVTTISAVGATICGTASISGISLGSNLASHSTNSSLTGTSYNGSAAVSDWGINLGNSNIFTVGQVLQASSTIFNLTTINATSTSATTTSLNVSAGATILGSSTFAGNATTSGTFFANNASSTKLFGANLPSAGCTGANALQWNAGLFNCVATATFGYPFLTSNNSTTSPIMFLASTTIGNGTLTGGLTINGGATTTGVSYFAGSAGYATTTPTGLLSIGANALNTTWAFNIGSSSGNYFGVNGGGGIVLFEQRAATSTTIALNWAATGPSILYQIGNAAVTITIYNATTSLYAGSRKMVTVCNPNATAGALTWVGVEWAGAAVPAQTATAAACDVWSFFVTSGTSTTAATSYKVFGAQSPNFQ